eukprot:TRINITY_DN13_c0_g1_i2.p1 TRINITY_DN13_c0_g1~~TRINITY_DN13_c0_g1_i2.p1  ORF type:complete len:2168 (+),score=835.08 TRINITY_DN13_c0_g1_i2:753-7256(+)
MNAIGDITMSSVQSQFEVVAEEEIAFTGRDVSMTAENINIEGRDYYSSILIEADNKGTIFSGVDMTMNAQGLQGRIDFVMESNGLYEGLNSNSFTAVNTINIGAEEGTETVTLSSNSNLNLVATENHHFNSEDFKMSTNGEIQVDSGSFIHVNTAAGKFSALDAINFKSPNTFKVTTDLGKDAEINGKTNIQLQTNSNFNGASTDITSFSKETTLTNIFGATFQSAKGENINLDGNTVNFAPTNNFNVASSEIIFEADEDFLSTSNTFESFSENTMIMGNSVDVSATTTGGSDIEITGTRADLRISSQESDGGIGIDMDAPDSATFSSVNGDINAEALMGFNIQGNTEVDVTANEKITMTAGTDINMDFEVDFDFSVSGGIFEIDAPVVEFSGSSVTVQSQPGALTMDPESFVAGAVGDITVDTTDSITIRSGDGVAMRGGDQFLVTNTNTFTIEADNDVQFKTSTGNDITWDVNAGNLNFYGTDDALEFGGRSIVINNGDLFAGASEDLHIGGGGKTSFTSKGSPTNVKSQDDIYIESDGFGDISFESTTGRVSVSSIEDTTFGGQNMEISSQARTTLNSDESIFVENYLGFSMDSTTQINMVPTGATSLVSDKDINVNAGTIRMSSNGETVIQSGLNNHVLVNSGTNSDFVANNKITAESDGNVLFNGQDSGRIFGGNDGVMSGSKAMNIIAKKGDFTATTSDDLGTSINIAASEFLTFSSRLDTFITVNTDIEFQTNNHNASLITRNNNVEFPEGSMTEATSFTDQNCGIYMDGTNSFNFKADDQLNIGAEKCVVFSAFDENQLNGDIQLTSSNTIFNHVQDSSVIINSQGLGGVSMTTTDVNGNVEVLAPNSEIYIIAESGSHSFTSTNSFALFSSFNDYSFYVETDEDDDDDDDIIFNNSLGMDIYGARGVTFMAGRDVTEIKGSMIANTLTSMEMTATNNINIHNTADVGNRDGIILDATNNIVFTAYNGYDIESSAAGEHTFTANNDLIHIDAENGGNVVMDADINDISFTTTNSFTISSDKGPIQFISNGAGGDGKITAGTDVDLLSTNGDINLYANNNGKIESNSILFNVQEGNCLTIHAKEDGASIYSTNQQVQRINDFDVLTAKGNNVEANANEITFNLNELYIGKESSPVVIFNTKGDVNVPIVGAGEPGFTLSSVGDINMITTNTFDVTTNQLSGELTATNIEATTNGRILVQSLQDFILLDSVLDITASNNLVDVQTPFNINFDSSNLLYIKSTGVDLTDELIFNSKTFINSQSDNLFSIKAGVWDVDVGSTMFTAQTGITITNNLDTNENSHQGTILFESDTSFTATTTTEGDFLFQTTEDNSRLIFQSSAELNSMQFTSDIISIDAFGVAEIKSRDVRFDGDSIMFDASLGGNINFSSGNTFTADALLDITFTTVNDQFPLDIIFTSENLNIGQNINSFTTRAVNEINYDIENTIGINNGETLTFTAETIKYSGSNYFLSNIDTLTINSGHGVNFYSDESIRIDITNDADFSGINVVDFHTSGESSDINFNVNNDITVSGGTVSITSADDNEFSSISSTSLLGDNIFVTSKLGHNFFNQADLTFVIDNLLDISAQSSDNNYDSGFILKSVGLVSMNAIDLNINVHDNFKSVTRSNGDISLTSTTDFRIDGPQSNSDITNNGALFDSNIIRYTTPDFSLDTKTLELYGYTILDFDVDTADLSFVSSEDDFGNFFINGQSINNSEYHSSVSFNSDTSMVFNIEDDMSLETIRHLHGSLPEYGDIDLTATNLIDLHATVDIDFEATIGDIYVTSQTSTFEFTGTSEFLSGHNTVAIATTTNIETGQVFIDTEFGDVLFLGDFDNSFTDVDVSSERNVYFQTDDDVNFIAVGSIIIDGGDGDSGTFRVHCDDLEFTGNQFTSTITGGYQFVQNNLISADDDFNISADDSLTFRIENTELNEERSIRLWSDDDIEFTADDSMQIQGIYSGKLGFFEAEPVYQQLALPNQNSGCNINGNDCSPGENAIDNALDNAMDSLRQYGLIANDFCSPFFGGFFFSSNSVPAEMPGFGVASTTAAIQINSGHIIDSNEMRVLVHLDISDSSNLNIVLRHQFSGQSTTLISTGSCTQEDFDYIFSPSAGAFSCAGLAPYSFIFGDLSPFDGQNAVGMWYLDVTSSSNPNAYGQIIDFVLYFDCT